jgi:hypothetical protein
MLKEHEDATPRPALMPKQTQMLLIAGAVGILLGVVSTWAAMSDATIHVFEGTTTIVDSEGTAFGWDPPSGANPGYSVAGAMWREPGGGWHVDGDTPSCLQPSSSGQTIRIGVMNVPLTDEAPGDTGKVVWFECLGRPGGSL